MACLDVTVLNDPGCHGNVTWAMQTGIYQNPTWYAQYPALSMFATFQDYQSVLAQKVGPGNGTAAGRGWQCPPPCNYHVPECFDVLPESPGQCYYNLMWAKNTGLDLHPEWYSGFPGLTVNSSLNDFQYVLHTKLVSGNGTGWQCPMPCQSTFIIPPTSAAPKFLEMTTVTTTTSTTTTTTVESSSALPLWGVLLLVLLAILLLCVAAVAGRAYLIWTKVKQPKKKRSVNEETVALRDRSVDSTASSALPITAASTAQDLFDRIDLNHDGVITRDEYARLSLFDQLDTNHDGVLTRDEYARFR